MTLSLQIFERNAQKYIEEAKADIKSVVFNGGNLDDFSNELAKIWGASRALIEGDIEHHLKKVQSDWDNLCGDELSQKGLDLGGLSRRSKFQSMGYAKIKGLAGLDIPNNLSFSASGLIFNIDNSFAAPDKINPQGFAIIPIISQNFGVNTNIQVGSYGVLAVNVNGIENKIPEIYATGGCDDENDDDYRNRLKFGDKLSKAPQSQGWVTFRALRYPRVLRVYFSTRTCCPNKFDIYPLVAGFKNYIPSIEFLQRMQKDVFDLELSKGFYASKTLGIKINLKAAIASGITVSILNSGGISQEQRSMIGNEIMELFNLIPVGGEICKSDFISIVRAIAGCAGKIEFTYNPLHYSQTETHLVANCDVLPILNDACFKY